MSDAVDHSDLPQDKSSAVSLQTGTPDVPEKKDNGSAKDKKMGQFTFDDFEHIRAVDSPQDFSGHGIGLRRSKRIPQLRSNKEMQELEEEAAAAEERERRAKLAQRAKARASERERLAKEKGKSSAGDSKDNAKNGTATKTAGTPELNEPPVTENNWTPNMPLLSSDFRTHHSVLSRLKNPNMRPIPYAGDVVKLMSFVNKFHLFFDSELLNLSFQDFEIGLDLYPGSQTGTASGMRGTDSQRTLFYQDFIPVKNVVTAQDKMNLLFMTLLKLTFSTSKSTEIQTKAQPQATMHQLKTSKKVFTTLVRQLRDHARSWGYPKEWRNNVVSEEELVKPQSRLFEQDDNGSPVDPKNPEILTSNIYTWYHHEAVPLEKDPLQNPDLEKKGILALEPRDRIICLRALTDWCGAQSPKIRTETYHLSHFKRDPAFGIQTSHAPRYLVEGPDMTYAQFNKLCSVIQSRYEIRSRKKHVKKALRNGRRPDLALKLNILKDIKGRLQEVPKEDRDETNISLYNKWSKLFDGEILDNPLSDPYEDELYKLRQQEFFIGRVPHIGDFFLPRLQTYPSSPLISTFLDLRNLESLFQDYANGSIDAFTLFENHGQTMSCQFKILYRDTPTMLRDVAAGKYSGNNYWYEMCHDCKTLEEFLEFLDYKITPGDPSQDKPTGQEQSKESQGENVLNETPAAESEKPKETSEKKVRGMTSTSTINKHPLPKEARFNLARKKLKYLKDFLSGMLPVLRVFEQLKDQYGFMKPGKRLLRRSQRRGVNYDNGAVGDTEDLDDEYIDDNSNEEDGSDESSELSEVDEGPEREVKKARLETREARSTRRSLR
ncbi:hypothetical protein HG536_0G01320 [Torulaspora globosa]|uniref:WHIM1 domain-containing protein n=1 Tax=Torulaspora globosa TaxID=48254 RepID=A0A7G3ZL87_9SACH|nr:uncharacterized protein HG536_0G01320 [Torulaspora globosa]QLL34273.1 hypothetical protein HG536_0G01320 [Torulaspora globosa]